jgi:hypothetical protein
VAVSGKVTAKTAKGTVPPAGATVTFVPKADPSAPALPTGTVGDDGTFTLTTHRPGDGAPPGEYAVTLFWPAAWKMTLGEGGGADQLGNRYTDPKTTPLSATVTAGGPNQFTFDVR